MYEYDYTICTEPDKDIFFRQCDALENHIPNIKKDTLLHDVDDSETQVYFLNDKKILVHNSYYIGAVYVESEIDLAQYFN